MTGDCHVRFCERLRGETPLCLLGAPSFFDSLATYPAAFREVFFFFSQRRQAAKGFSLRPAYRRQASRFCCLSSPPRRTGRYSFFLLSTLAACRHVHSVAAEGSFLFAQRRQAAKGFSLRLCAITPF